MVTEFGMSDKLARSRSESGDELVFLGRRSASSATTSDEVASRSTRKSGLIDTAYERAMDVLVTHVTKLNALARSSSPRDGRSDGFEALLLRPAPKRNSRETHRRSSAPNQRRRAPSPHRAPPGLIRGRATSHRHDPGPTARVVRFRPRTARSRQSRYHPA